MASAPFSLIGRASRAALTGLSALIVSEVASAQAARPATDNQEIMRRAFEAWAAGTGGPYDLLAEDASWTITGHSLASKTYGSREAFMSEVIRPFNARMRTGLKPTIRNLYADGDTVIVFFDAGGIAADGKPYNNTYAWFLEMRGGKVARAHAFFDSIVFNELWTRVQPAK